MSGNRPEARRWTALGLCLGALLATPVVAGAADGATRELAARSAEWTAEASTIRLAQARNSRHPGEEGGRLQGCPPGTIQKPETDDCIAAPPGREGSGRPVPGRSLGGILRAGPSQQSARVTSLSEGQRFTILRHTGVVTDGYAWFEVQVGSIRGFQWGGILCADVAMPGVFEVCKGASGAGVAQGQPAQPAPAVAAPAPPTPRSGPAWCASARLPAEHAICGNPELSRLDDVLNVAYRRATSDSRGKRTEIDREHRRWVGRRNACGNDSACLGRRYQEQIQILETYFAN